MQFLQPDTEDAVILFSRNCSDRGRSFFIPIENCHNTPKGSEVEKEF